jgi:hypothetical protein
LFFVFTFRVLNNQLTAANAQIDTLRAELELAKANNDVSCLFDVCEKIICVLIAMMKTNFSLLC